MQLLDQTNYLQMVLVLDDQTETNLLSRYHNIIEVRALDKRYAAKMLKSLDKSDEIYELSK